MLAKVMIDQGVAHCYSLVYHHQIILIAFKEVCYKLSMTLTPEQGLGETLSKCMLSHIFCCIEQEISVQQQLWTIYNVLSSY